MKIFSSIIILLLLIFGVSFSLLNINPVSVHYYLGVTTLPLSLLLMISFAFGAIFAMLMMGFVLIRYKARNIGLKRRLRVAEKELENLRTLPVEN